MSLKNTYGSKKGNYMLKTRLKSWGLFLVCVLLTLICLLPIYMLILFATKSNMQINTTDLVKMFTPGDNLGGNIHQLFNNSRYEQFKIFYGYRNSAAITIGAMFLTVFFGALTAYGIHIYDFKFKEIAFTAILVVMMVPAQVMGGGLLDMLLNWGMVNTWIPLIIPAMAPPAVVFFMRSYMKSSFPGEIVEAARIDGSSEFGTFIRIALPMMKPAIAVQAIFAFIAKWNDLYTPNMLLFKNSYKIKTLPQMVSGLTGGTQPDWGVINLGISMSILPIIIAYVFLSRFIIAGVALGGVKE